jgi:Fe-S oxidoreductase/FAD/FMN-containing dehydrogenase
MRKEEKRKLVNIFGDRVTFNKIERMLYSSDLSTLPEFVKKQLSINPDAVVQPNNSADLKALLNLAMKYKTPLIPRGSGTAGYGGAVPARGGIVVDFYLMNQIKDIDKGKRLAIVEPGILWNNLEAELYTHGLALRLYPGSAISATVGGWIANGGGAGIGSFEYGYIKDNILEFEIITPKGTRKLAGSEIDLVNGMAGTTGFISQITLMVRDSEDDIPILVAFSSLKDVLDSFKKICEKKLALWEVGYRDPLHVRLNAEAIEIEAKKLPVPHEIKESGLPQDKFIVMFAYPKSRDGMVKDKLLSIVKAHNGEVLSEELARAEWAERFYPMRLKALGPSLIPSEINISTEKLLMLIEEIKGRIEKFAYNGTLVNYGSQTILLTYILDDERRPGFPLAYSKSFIPIKAAKKLGGKPYAIGMYLIDDTELLLGKEKLLKIYKFKKEVDPIHIMNPGKVFPRFLDKSSPLRLNMMLKLAKNGEKSIRALDRFFGGKSLGEVIDQKTKIGKLPFGKKMAWDAFACANCGYCRSGCPEFNAIGWESASPRGKFHFLREYLKGNTKIDERMAEMFFLCTTCGDCNLMCQIKSYIDEHWTLTARPAVWQEGFNPPMVFQLAASNILFKHNPGGVPQSQRKEAIPPRLKYREEGEIGYWAGCNATFNKSARSLLVNGIRILNKAGIEPAYMGSEEWCCGGGSYLVGCIEEIEETVKHNIDQINQRGIKTLITSCPGCWYYLALFYPIFAWRLNLEYKVGVRHITEVISELVEKGKIKLKFPVNIKVTYHDPCHIARGGEIFEAPRKILTSIPGLELIEMLHNKKNTACCGRHTTRYPRVGSIINGSRLNEAIQTGAQALICACPTCGNNFRTAIDENGSKLEVLDLSDLVAESMGLPTLVVGKLNRLMNHRLKRKSETKAGILLTEAELSREENLFRPHELSYAPLKSRTEDIRSLCEKMGADDSMPKPPSGC